MVLEGTDKQCCPDNGALDKQPMMSYSFQGLLDILWGEYLNLWIRGIKFDFI